MTLVPDAIEIQDLRGVSIHSAPPPRGLIIACAQCLDLVISPRKTRRKLLWRFSVNAIQGGSSGKVVCLYLVDAPAFSCLSKGPCYHLEGRNGICLYMCCTVTVLPLFLNSLGYEEKETRRKEEEKKEIRVMNNVSYLQYLFIFRGDLKMSHIFITCRQCMQSRIPKTHLLLPSTSAEKPRK